MIKHCGNCAVYDRKNMKHSELCGKCVIEHFPNGKESDPSMWKPLPQTNADRIRGMSDDELAEFLCEVNGCYQVNCPGAEMCVYRGGKANGLKKWLKQPAKGE